MKRKHVGLAEVQLSDSIRSLSPVRFAAGAAFAVQLPEGATIAVPAGFDADEVFRLLTVDREALR